MVDLFEIKFVLMVTLQLINCGYLMGAKIFIEGDMQLLEAINEILLSLCFYLLPGFINSGIQIAKFVEF
jgi:hypothetical protein